MMQTEEKVKGGRKRTHLVKVFLNDEEYEKLCKGRGIVQSRFE